MWLDYFKIIQNNPRALCMLFNEMKKISSWMSMEIGISCSKNDTGKGTIRIDDEIHVQISIDEREIGLI